MSIPEEIEHIKLQLTHVDDEQLEANLIVELLQKYTSINSADSIPYIDRILVLAEKLNDGKYRALGTYYLAFAKKLIGQYDISRNLSQVAMNLFEDMNDMEGVAKTWSLFGNLDQIQSKYPEAIQSYLKALKIREVVGDNRGIANSLSNIANNYQLQGIYSEARIYNLKALKLREEYGDMPGVAQSINDAGVIYELEGNYSEALDNYLKAKHTFELIGDKSGAANSYLNIGNIHIHQGNYTEALKYHNRALNIMEQTGNKLGIANCFSNIGVIYELKGNYSEALESHSHSLKINQEINNKQGIANAFNNMGVIYELQKKYSEALENNFRSLKIREEIGDQVGVACSYNALGNVYEKQGKFAEAISNIVSALEIGEKIGNKDLIRESSLLLRTAYKNTGDFENALKFHEKFHQLDSEMLGEQSQKQLNSLNFMHNLEQKEKDLEIEHLRNVELKTEKERSESLLLNILPADVAEELKEKGTAGAKMYEDVTVLFTDFKDFTTVAQRLSPQQLVDELHVCFSAFDKIMEKYNIEKIKTVGDAYLAVSGLPQANANHAIDLVRAAIEIRDFMLERKGRDPIAMWGTKDERNSRETFEVRIGVHSGSVVAGIVGVKKFAYDIWGDTVNTAARMEQNSEAGKINVSQTTFDLIKGKFKCEYRGKIEAKNKGKLQMFFVLGELD